MQRWAEFWYRFRRNRAALAGLGIVIAILLMAAAAQKYRDSTPSGSEVRPIAGQPKILQSPAQ